MHIIHTHPSHENNNSRHKKEPQVKKEVASDIGNLEGPDIKQV